MSNETKHSKSRENGGTWWFYQLRDNFFNDPNIRRLQRTTGDTGVMIFLQMVLKSLRTDGYIERVAAELGESFAEEISFDLNRDVKEVEAVVACGKKLGLIVPVATNLFYFPCVTDNVKTLTRQGRDNRKSRAAERAERAMQQSCGNAQQSCDNNTNTNTNNQESDLQNNDNQNYFVKSEDCLFSEEDVERYGERATTSGSAAEAAPVVVRSLSELMEIAQEHDIGLNELGIKRFYEITHGATVYGKKSMYSVEGSMKHWAGVNKERHPEYFTSTGKTGTEGTAAARDPGELPIWDPESPKFVECSNDDYSELVDMINEIRPKSYEARAEEGEEQARKKYPGHNDEWYADWGQEYAARHFMLNREKREPGYLSAGVISCLMDYYSGWDDPEFYDYFCKYRANG